MSLSSSLERTPPSWVWCEPSLTDRRRPISRPVVIGFDGSPSAAHTVRTAAALLGSVPGLIVVVWEAGLGSELLETPRLTPAPIDIRTALEVDRSIYEGAQQLAETGAAIARQAGMDATGLAVADDVTVAETLVRLTNEHHARAVVVGTHGRRRLHQAIGRTARAVVEQATCPTVVIRHTEPDS